jgi:hypothetical protein
MLAPLVPAPVFLRKAVRPLRSVNPRDTPTARSNIKSPRDPLHVIRTERGSSGSRFSVQGGVHRADPHLGQHKTLTHSGEFSPRPLCRKSTLKEN